MCQFTILFNQVFEIDYQKVLFQADEIFEKLSTD